MKCILPQLSTLRGFKLQLYLVWYGHYHIVANASRSMLHCKGCISLSSVTLCDSSLLVLQL